MSSNKICLVTGANSGIGKEVALGLAKAGAQVIMVCRNETKGKTALDDVKIKSGSDKVNLLIADLSSIQSIRNLAKEVIQKYPNLNVLINNAGVIMTKRNTSVDGIELTLATNVIAPILLTDLLLNLLKQNAPARIINVSSDIHRRGEIDINDLGYKKRKFGFMRVYGQSKLLLNIASFSLAKKLEGTGVTLNCIHPGAVRTALGNNNVNELINKVVDIFVKSFFLSAKKSAIPIIDLALSPKWENVTGKYFDKATIVNPSEASLDSKLADKVNSALEKLIH